MQDVFGLEELGKYRQAKFQEEAARERMLRQVNPRALHLSSSRRVGVRSAIAVAMSTLAGLVTTRWATQTR